MVCLSSAFSASRCFVSGMDASPSPGVWGGEEEDDDDNGDEDSATIRRPLIMEAP